MELGRALSFLRKAQPQAALDILDNFITLSSYKDLFPEALYWAGVASFFLNKRDPKSLVAYWERLMWSYPENIWAQRADILNVEL
jgi:hypothetical protein